MVRIYSNLYVRVVFTVNTTRGMKWDIACMYGFVTKDENILSTYSSNNNV